MPLGWDGKGTRPPWTLHFGQDAFCRVRVSSQGPTVVSQRGHHRHWEGTQGDAASSPYQASLRGPGSPEYQNPSHTASLTPAHPMLGWHCLSCPHKPGGKDDGHLGCTTLTPQITSTPQTGHQVTPPAAHSLKDLQQDEAIYRLH